MTRTRLEQVHTKDLWDLAMTLEAGYQAIVKGSRGTEAARLIAVWAGQRPKTCLLLKLARTTARLTTVHKPRNLEDSCRTLGSRTRL